MARVGFKRSYAEGAFDVTAAQALFAAIKAYLAMAGFTVCLESEDTIDVLRLGADPALPDDDTPHWAFRLVVADTIGEIRATPVYGANVLDPAARSCERLIVNTTFPGTPSRALTLWFAADGVAGWWWLHGQVADDETSAGVSMLFPYAGVTTRRYAADTHQGLCARYGLRSGWGDWYPAYALDEEGNVVSDRHTNTWSPFGEGYNCNGNRHAGSPLARLAVPQFPNRENGITACVLGEFNEILVLTDGYAQEEALLPGWIALTGSEWDQPYAAPAPAQFDLLLK